MSLRKSRRRKLMDQSHTSTRNRFRTCNLITSELLKQSSVQFESTPMHCNKMKQSAVNSDINSKEKNIHDNSLNGTITPEYKPTSVTLTPLRTRKTPKRSPVNLASPKIRSEVPVRLTKTPRKRQLFYNSPTNSSNFDKSLLDRKSINNNIQNTTLGNISVNDVDVKPNKLRKSQTFTDKLKLMPGRSSESSKKHVSRKVSAFSNKNNSNEKILSSEESQLEVTLTNGNDLSEEYKEIISKKPIVLLERIPLLDNFSASLKTQNNQHLTNTTLDVAKHVRKQLFKHLIFSEHSISQINHKYPIETEESILPKSFNNTENMTLNSTYSIISSTPISKRSSNSLATPVSLSDESVKRNLLEEDVKNSTYDMNKTDDNQNNTMVIENEEIADADKTHDLFQPKTPHLRQQLRKSATVEVDNDKKEIKKVVKVRFTTPERQIEKVQSNNNISIRKTPRVKYISRKRSNSLSNTPTNKNTPNPEWKRRSISMSNINTTLSMSNNKKEKTPSSTYSQIKSNTESERKKDVKTQSAKKKIPNFVEIHKQMFAKMESVVDNKKRLIQQHEALIAKTHKVLRLDKNNIKKFRLSEAKEESHNRYGFRMKKAEATNIILKKKHTNVPKKKREENTAILKGVRTNKRFELLMKMRKISH